MKLSTWDPLKEMEDVITRYLKPANRLSMNKQDLLATGDWAPRADILETDSEFTVKLDLPEVKKDDVKITVDNGVLSIRGERKQEKEEKGTQYHRIECHYGNFVRSFSLPDNVAEDQIEAVYENGVLFLAIPKTEESKPKQIEVTIK
ncbi:MAG: Hsp20/alpha crystallin family protein [Desulfobacteraceae bacterium]|nr:MAG: Hsp20/alpha crystallin family protein [Desulfobacteraceae bacterium]